MKNIPIELSPTEEKRRDWYEIKLSNAQRRVSEFAREYQWDQFVATPLIKKFLVCSTKEQFDKEVISAFQLDPETTIPKTYSAVISQEVLLAVTPETYAENYPNGQEEHAYEKLLAHELAHAFHIRILEGKEEEMGPRWFYEGFALLVANQFEYFTEKMKKEDMQKIINTDESVSYVYYRQIMDEMLKQMDVKHAVNCARELSFRIIL
ncbi:hypothetical protein [Bacillus pinisoli]|uniref:hypothetical protein n=1 Tax=Bacillus pinisoli TaxID=2901866 RepID=UPI001FF2F6A7|nr:hypothetical protein [Bacillus pinisoli]